MNWRYVKYENWRIFYFCSLGNDGLIFTFWRKKNLHLETAFPSTLHVRLSKKRNNSPRVFDQSWPLFRPIFRLFFRFLKIETPVKIESTYFF